MELLFVLWYNMGHETIWYPKAVGKATPTRHSASEKRQNKFVGSRNKVRSIQKLCFEMVEDIPEERRRRFKTQTCIRSSMQINEGAEKGSGTSSSKWTSKSWLLNRSLDIGTYRQGDSSAFSNSLPSPSCMEDSERFRLEQSEARATGTAAERGRD